MLNIMNHVKHGITLAKEMRERENETLLPVVLIIEELQVACLLK